MFFKQFVFVVATVSVLSQAQGADLTAANKAARAEALDEIELSADSPIEARYLDVVLAKFKRMGLVPGPLCIEMKGKCYTQRELGYRSSEYYSIGELRNLPKAGLYTSVWQARFPTSEANQKIARVSEETGINQLVLVQAIELKEKLELSYLAAYEKKHPSRPRRDEGDYTYDYSWKVSVDGEVVESEAIYGNGDH